MNNINKSNKIVINRQVARILIDLIEHKHMHLYDHQARINALGFLTNEILVAGRDVHEYAELPAGLKHIWKYSISGESWSTNTIKERVMSEDDELIVQQWYLAYRNCWLLDNKLAIRLTLGNGKFQDSLYEAVNSICGEPKSKDTYWHSWYPTIEACDNIKELCEDIMQEYPEAPYQVYMLRKQAFLVKRTLTGCKKASL